MGMIFFMIAFPVFIAFVLLFLRGDGARDIIVRSGAAVFALAAVVFVCSNFSEGYVSYRLSEAIAGKLSMVTEILSAFIGLTAFCMGVRYKRPIASLLALIQTPLMLWFELTTGHTIEVKTALYADRLSFIMLMIIGIVGGLIAVYAIPYMKDFEAHRVHEVREAHVSKGIQNARESFGVNAAYKDRRYFFFFLIFVFLGAMVGIVCSNDLLLLFFFWEVTTLCSFFMIGYTKTPEAIGNSFLALELNLFGGIAFALGIIYLGRVFGTLELTDLIALGMAGYARFAIFPIACLALAALTKAAQMPFNKWLLGAMVAPTPTSALLHSSTMVKAGVFLILKLSPCLGLNVAGLMVMAAGSLTFLFASFAAISQSNAKRVLAYSTVANLGLIVTLGGIGSYGALWAGVFLLIFHACTKSLLFLAVGTAEHNIGSRDIEDMDGLFERLPHLAIIMIIGISAMFLAPLGMLVSKWAALVAFVDSGLVPLIAIIAFGSAATSFYWLKWLGKISASVRNVENTEGSIRKDEWFVLSVLAGIALLLCFLLPLLSNEVVVPYLYTVFGFADGAALSEGNLTFLLAMVFLVVILPLLLYGKAKGKRETGVYLAGVNDGDDRHFRNSFQGSSELSLRNLYLEEIFGEKRMNLWGSVASTVSIALVFALLIGQIIGEGGGF